ncbi:cytoskeletal motor fibril protein Fib [Spiroplasma tabanidicola]|uniref:Adenosylhomocysteine nucleosidase n=1 Tax=Spiroplasma tabanidicola TaxID=324079 RepID=A0A6I6C4X5_9MOLU|nr:cytoskeletal motor fibril protein Fib [Spiroplasma tabanidicola]QGS51877.1 adenosylhomocysteine nucleosidase [Spiroplasma tabanidicola]
MIGIISTAYFTVRDREGVKTVKKYWWRNMVIQHIKYRGKFFIVATIGYGKANAAMAITYLMEEYPSLETVLNVDLALSTNDKFDTTDTVMSTKFIYRDADLTVFKDIKYGQIVHEPEAFAFNTELVTQVKNFKLGVSDGIVGTADMLIYNSKQFKEMVDKYGQTIDVIDTEAGALAQVAKKSSVNFVALKIMYNNALSPWDNDPLHKFKIYETSNTLKYLLARLFNLLSSRYIIDFSKNTNDELEVINELFELEHDAWIRRFKKDTVSLISGMGPSLMLLDKKAMKPEAVDVVEVMKPKIEDEGPSKVILGEDEWKNAPKKWLRKLMFLQNLSVNDDELLWNKSAKYDLKTGKIFTIEDVAKNIAKLIADRSQDKSSYTYDGTTVNKKHLFVACDAQISFYITHNHTHEFVEGKKKGSQLVANEFMKHLNQMLAEVESPFEKIIVYIKIPAVGSARLPIFLTTKNKVNTPIVFGGYSEKDQNVFTVVDITRNDYDPLKVGSFKVTVRLKTEG